MRGASVSDLGKSQTIEAVNVSKARNGSLRRPFADRELAADDIGEDDWTFFRARPNERSRIRSPFPGEFPRKILKQGRGRQAVVIVAIDRDAVTGEPRTRGRGILFVEGGRA